MQMVPFDPVEKALIGAAFLVIICGLIYNLFSEIRHPSPTRRMRRKGRSRS